MVAVIVSIYPEKSHGCNKKVIVIILGQDRKLKADTSAHPWDCKTHSLVSRRATSFPTWFFPFSISRLVTFPKGSPRPITSASFMSLGSLRTWTTRDGTPGLRTSPLNFLLSLPLAARENRSRYNQGGNRRLRFFLNNGLIPMATQTQTCQALQ